ncbi:hypothetical protein KL86DES1_20998 [uncultured Desulfovibrio sp.]|uniref:Uncharacterized protein n=1 Tax=uncultured Desulfovibrio sp. TaxID=167968 RepID=A0A212L6E0_9BACT|nr:hypothetical protein KL86DES1_20998 [uncultured Desulfovibrio sp.]VZH33899.1 conserved protein of unknown function [Desulfovibrio sp. 86]
MRRYRPELGDSRTLGMRNLRRGPPGEHAWLRRGQSPAHNASCTTKLTRNQAWTRTTRLKVLTAANF